MATTATPDWLEACVKKAIESRITDMVIKRVADAKKAIDDEVPTIIAGVALDVFSQIDLLRDQRQLLIRLKDETTK